MSLRAGRSLLLTLAALCLAEAFPAVQEAHAQYFGRNQVRYDRFDFQVLETEHFDLFHYEEKDGQAALHVGRMSERWYARLSRMLDYEFRDRQPFVLYASHPHFRQTTAIVGQVGEGTEGVTEPLKRRVVMPMAGPLAETDHIVGHEIVHAFQFALSGVDPTAPLTGAPALMGLPLWVVEGMAEYLSLGPRDPQTAMWLRDALASERDLPTVRDLRNARRWFPYRWGHALWAYIGGRWGDERVGEMLKAGIRTRSPEGAIRVVLEIDPDTLARDWHQAIRDTYESVLERTRPASEFAEPLITEDGTGGSLNVGPALSPDGRHLVFLSERGRFAIDMFLADAETGEVIRQITRTAMDPHFQSLEFISSAGSWSPDGRSFAFTAVVAGRPVLTVVDPETGRQIREIRLSGLGEAFNPTWSPDGRRIALTANTGGVLNLAVVELETGEVRLLTDDPYAVLHPAWSPDGEHIAFATDRFTSDVEILQFGDYRLAAAHAATGEVRALPSLEGGKNVNPSWSPEGRFLFFIAEPDGIANLYRLEVATGSIDKLTDVQTGLYGITSLSPALSVASGSGDVVFSVFEGGNHNLYRMDATRAGGAGVGGPGHGTVAEEGVEEDGNGARRVARAPADDPAALPPLQRRDDLVAGLLADPQLGLPDPVTFDIRPYRASLGLDFIAQPSLALGFSSFGGFIGGGAALFFSDMLGHHNLATQLQLQVIDGSSLLNGIGALGQYLNRERRLFWGATAGQVPLFTRGFRQALVEVDGQPAILAEEIRFWQLERPAIAVAQYPFSQVLRAEFAAGFQQTAFSLDIRQQAFHQATGQRLLDQTVDAPACGDTLTFRRDFCEPGTINQVLGTAALVYDNTLFGPTGPMAGQRFRFEGTPFAGTLNYVNALADFRRYVMPFQPVTLAGRVLHFGRYGGDAEDERLQQLFLGFPSLVRGYDTGSFGIRHCPPDVALDQCVDDINNLFESLLGTRVGVANLEARIPLLGPLGLLGGAGGIPPLDLIGFFDTGVAWTRAEGPDLPLFDGDRRLVSSAGVGIRMNLFGFFIGELDWVVPFDRADRDNFIAFYLIPAF